MPFRYSAEQRARYNKYPGGLGLGVSRREGHNEYSLYAIGFRDSFYRFQGTLGYAWTAKVFEPGTFFNIGGGFTMTAQFRYEYKYIPMPLPMPIASVEIGPLAVQGAYVVGFDVAIFWLKLRIPI